MRASRFAKANTPRAERQLNAAAFLPTTKDDRDVYSLDEGERRAPPTFRRATHGR